MSSERLEGQTFFSDAGPKGQLSLHAGKRACHRAKSELIHSSVNVQ